MGSFCQSDEGHFHLSENGVPAQQKYGLKRLFSTLGLFAAFLTLQFSGLTAAPFFGGMDSTVKERNTPEPESGNRAKIGIFPSFHTVPRLGFPPLTNDRQKNEMQNMCNSDEISPKVHAPDKRICW